MNGDPETPLPADVPAENPVEEAAADAAQAVLDAGYNPSDADALLEALGTISGELQTLGDLHITTQQVLDLPPDPCGPANPPPHIDTIPDIPTEDK